jgi:hypothetical protein
MTACDPKGPLGSTQYRTLNETKMLSDKDFATKVLAETAECLRRLNALLLEAQETVPADEFNQLRRGVGRVLGYMYTDVDRPIHKMHPELEPEELKDR